MQNNDYKKYIKLIEDDNINVSETNVLKEFFQITLKLVLIFAGIYIFVFILSGMVIKGLSIDKQILLEDFLAKSVNIKTLELDSKDSQKFEFIKNKIKSHDKNFPKTSKLYVEIVPDKSPNALCLANGNIYITSALYDKIKNDENMLTFTLAHEIAHYKNKDHLMTMRKNISSGIGLILFNLIGAKDTKKIISGVVDLSNLNYSRKVEARADKYATIILLKEYGNTQGAKKVFEILKDKEYPRIFYIFSTHPTIEDRIKNVQKIEQKYAH